MLAREGQRPAIGAGSGAFLHRRGKTEQQPRAHRTPAAKVALDSIGRDDVKRPRVCSTAFGARTSALFDAPDATPLSWHINEHTISFGRRGAR